MLDASDRVTAPSPSASPRARYTHIETHPRFLAVDLAQRLIPGTFEHALHPLLHPAVALRHVNARIRNDYTGARAYPPAMLREVVPFAHSHGIVSSRGIARALAAIVAIVAICDAAFEVDGSTLTS